MGKKLPDRWLKYKPYGEVIKNTRIIAFKVPLKYEICRQLLPSDQFTPEILMKAFPNLKYIIDLTATARYYKKTEFTSAGITHVKVEVPGQQVPKQRHSLKFFDVMDTFMSVAKDDELIGVHCTHGLNRTGYMICQYLIRQLGWDATDAVKGFEEARGYPMERQPYLDELGLMLKGVKLKTKIDRTILDSRNDKTNWRNHQPPLPAPPPTPFDNYSSRSYSREYSQRRRRSAHNSKELLTPSSSTWRSQQNIHKQQSPSQPLQYSWREDKSHSKIVEPGNETTNIAEKIRKLENTFPIIHNKNFQRRNASNWTDDLYDSNLNTAHTVTMPQTSKRKHKSNYN